MMNLTDLGIWGFIILFSLFVMCSKIFAVKMFSKILLKKFIVEGPLSSLVLLWNQLHPSMQSPLEALHIQHQRVPKAVIMGTREQSYSHEYVKSKRMSEASPGAIHLAKQGTRGLRVLQRHSFTPRGKTGSCPALWSRLSRNEAYC